MTQVVKVIRTDGELMVADQHVRRSDVNSTRGILAFLGKRLKGYRGRPLIYGRSGVMTNS